MHDLTGFQRDLLWAIAGYDDGAKGLKIKADLEDYYGNGEINHGRLYPNLDELVERGLVVKGEIDRRTNRYEISQRGKRELVARHRWQEATVDEVTA
jgi:PadR family transcriptional regulator PadR